MSASKSPPLSARAARASSRTVKSSKAFAGTIAPFADEILDGLAEGFFALDAEWRFIAFNRAAEEAFGLKRADLIGRELWEVSPATRGTEFERRYREAMSKREKQVFEARPTRAPDRWHAIRAFPLGEGIGVAFRDVTEDKAALEGLRERERGLARVQEIGRLGGIRIDLSDGFTVYRSAEYLSLYGLPPEAAVEDHETWSRRLHPEDREAAVARFFRAVASEARDYASEFRIVRPSDGAVRWIRSVGRFERDATGKAVGLIGAHIDITERKLAEQEARESEAQLLAIADALPVLISYVDKEQVFRFVNKTYETWFERPRSEILGRRVEEVMSPAMYEARRPYVERALAGEMQSYEVDFTRAGGPIATEVIHVPHRDAGGRVLGFYAIVADITNRRLAERKAAESEARFRSIADSAPAPMWVTGADGRREFVNRAYLDFFGGSLEDALSFDWRRRLHPDDRARVLSEEPRIDASVKSMTVEARFLRHDGAWRWLRAVSQPRWGPAGEHAGFIGAAYDVTEAKQAQDELTRINETLESRVAERTAQLAASEALVRTFFQHSSDIHVVLVEDGDSFRFQEANPAALRVYGRPWESVVGHRTEEVFGREAAAEVDRHLWICLSRSATHRYDVQRGAATIEAVASPVPVRPGEPRRVVVSAHDISERRRLEEQLRQARKMEALGQLTGGVAHDFNNLLTLILGGLDTIDRLMAQAPAFPAKERIERARDMALQGVQRARSLTARLLAFSRRQTLAPQSVDANALVAGIGDLLHRTLGEQITLTTILADGLWRAFVDPNQLENALLNLALNARDAMPRGGRLVLKTANRHIDADEAEALPERVDPGDYVMIAVMDTGAGMDEETRARAFDPFFTTKEVGKGTGLGLSQVYGFSRQSGGYAVIESEPGHGATVRIFLPRQASAPAERIVEDQPDLERPGGRESVLVVEDDDAVRAYATETLRELGYRVAEASRGKAALEILKQAGRLDLLLTDVVMPGDLNGRELAEEALKRRPGLRVLFMTGYSRDAIARLGSGAHVLSKPFSLRELAEKVRTRLDAQE